MAFSSQNTANLQRFLPPKSIRLEKSLLDCVNPLPLKDVVGLDFLLNQGAPYQVSIVRQRIKVGIKPATIQILILIYLV